MPGDRDDRGEVIHALERLAVVAHDRGDYAAEEQSRALAGRLRSDVFNLAVVGQYKRGKTTLINALLGRELLPSAIVPLTAVVTIIQHGPAESVTIHFQDGRQEQVSAAALADYVTERGNPANQRAVAAAEVFIPCDLLATGLRLIDTPGVGSVHAHNTQTAYAFIPHIDAAVFMLAADPPVGKEELGFLRDLVREVSTVFFVQNKVDQVPAADRQESLEFSRRQIALALDGDAPEVYALSAKEGLAGKLTHDPGLLQRSGLPAFEMALVGFSQGKRGEAALAGARRVLRRLLQQEQAAIGVETAALNLPLEELERKQAAFQAHLEQLRRANDDNRILLRAAGQRVIVQVLDRDLRALQAANRPALLAGLEEVAARSERATARILLEHLNTFIQDSIGRLYDGWVQAEEPKIAEALKDAAGRFATQANEAVASLAKLSEELFHAQLGDVTVEEELAGRREFFSMPWQMQVSPDTVPVTLLYLLPGRWMRRQLLRAAAEKLSEQLDMHGGRVRYDFVRRLERSLRDFEQSLTQAMEALARAVEEAVGRAIARKQQAGESAALRHAELQRQQASLGEIGRVLGEPAGEGV